MRVLVTGATGFIGRHVVARLGDSHAVVAPVRNALPPGLRAEAIRIEGIHGRTDWREALAGVDAVVHAAAVAHRGRGHQATSGEVYDEVNARGTLALAEAAERAGVRTFVFLSSITVNGTSTNGRGLFTEDDPPAEQGVYELSKRRAEEGLAALSERTGLGVTVVRPPLVYGLPAKGNVALLLGAMRRGLPLPLASVGNRRAFVAVDTLVDFIAGRLTRTDGGFETFIVADEGHVSTPDFVTSLGLAAGLKPRLLPFPVGALRTGLKFAGRGALVESLLDSLEVDISRARATGWSPRSGTREGLARTLAGITMPLA
jgi:nucleoside-diphosphate-sugar epimerase